MVFLLQQLFLSLLGTSCFLFFLFLKFFENIIKVITHGVFSSTLIRSS